MPIKSEPKKRNRVRPDNAMIMSRRTAMESYASKYINILQDPDEVLSRAGLNVATAFKEIETDGHMTSVMGKRAAAVKALEWDIIRGKASSAAHKLAVKQFGEDRINITTLIDEIMQKNPWGMAPIEVKWTEDDGAWLISEFSGKPARWFRFDEENKIRFISLKNPIDGEIIPDYKLLVARNNPTHDNPYGEKLLSKSYWPVTWKRNGFKWWNIFIEKFAIPGLIAKLPPSASEDDYDEVLDMLDRWVQDNTTVLPNTIQVDTLEAKNKTASADIFQAMCRYMDSEVSKVWLGETLTTEVGDVGSYAAAKVHQGVADERRDADKHEIERVINQAIKWLVTLNFGDVPAPKFVMSSPLIVAKEQAEIDAILSRELGVKFNADYIAEEYGKDPAHFVMVEKPEPVEPPPGQENPFAFAEAKDQAILGRAIDVITDTKLQAQAAKAMKPIIDIIEHSESYAEALDAMLAAYKDMTLEKAETVLRNAYFVSQSWGRLNAR